jgi:Asp-tRNA(Asn)/Glu-tRNA(Gln) amidotransferase A subunit family amidase
MVAEERQITGREVVENLTSRDRMRLSLLKRMETTRVLLTPPCGVTAFLPGERQWQAGDRSIGLREAMAPATPFNLFGLPAVVIPFGMTPDGLPVGVQLVGRPWDEELLLELAVRMENARGPFGGPPV